MSLVIDPVPRILPETEPFWDATERNELLLQLCNDCGKHFFPPAPICQHCLSRNVVWEAASGLATLYSYVIAQNPWPEWRNNGPMSVALVELAEGPRLTSTIVDCPQTPEALRFGMPLKAVFRPYGADQTLLCFQPEDRAERSR